jgi:transcriptional regulator with XRE-family HTH domain
MMQMDNSQVGNLIRSLRIEKGLTQQLLADQLHVTNAAVSKWETGKGMPDSSIMLSLCKCLDISITDLLSGEKVSKTERTEKAEENVINLLKDIEEIKVLSNLSEEEQVLLAEEFKNTTSAKNWKKMNILSIIQSLFWIGIYVLSIFLNWGQIAQTVLLVMMVLNATVPLVIIVVRLAMYSIWLNITKRIKEV